MNISHSNIMRLVHIIRLIHSYLGLFVGIIIIIVALSGCVYSFQKEIRLLLYPKLLEVKVPLHTRQLSVASLLQLAEKAYPESNVREIVLFNAAHKSVKVYTQDHHLLYLNPYSGQVLGIKNSKKDPFLLAWSLHTQLGMGKFGSQLVAYATLSCIPLIITGIWLWRPRIGVRWRKHFLLPTQGKWKLINFQWHRIGGFYASLFLFFICLTGLMMSFPALEEGLYKLFGSTRAVRTTPTIMGIPTSSTALEKSITYCQSHFPNYKELQVFFPNSRYAGYMLIAKYGDRFGSRELLYFHPESGQLLQHHPSTNQALGDRLKAMNYRVHSGQLGGLVGQILAFLTSLFTVYLVISGAIMWYQRRFR